MNEINKQVMNDDLKIFALGGLCEVGKNMYGIEYRDEIIILDAGIMFPDDEFGIDYIIPDFTYLLENESKIKGLFITHGHEDHIGGIPYLLKQVKIPKIYSNGLTTELIKKKIEENPGTRATIYQFNPIETINFKYLSVSFFRVNHSIPDSFGLIIHTPYGDVVSTGDFKLDLTPVGKDADYRKICALGQKGILLLLSDSTNAKVKELSTSERVVVDNISDIFRGVKGRVIIATFASNVHRINSIISASVNNGRKVCIIGRSMENSVAIGRDLKLINHGDDVFIDVKHIDNYDKNQITIICTGSQGEPMAALTRMVSKDGLRLLKIEEGDTVIFSSSAIPGNSVEIDSVINRLTKLGAEVIVRSSFNDVHASGHASSNEEKLLIKLLSPKYFMPMHGEYYMLKTHAKSAMECGIPQSNIFVLENGKVLAIGENGARVLSKRIPSSDIWIDGTDVGGMNMEVVQQRKVLAKRGMVTPVIILNPDGKVTIKPTVISKGFLYAQDNNTVFTAIEDFIIDYFNNNVVVNEKETKLDLSEKLTAFIEQICQKSPVVFIILNQIK